MRDFANVRLRRVGSVLRTSDERDIAMNGPCGPAGMDAIAARWNAVADALDALDALDSPRLHGDKARAQAYDILRKALHAGGGSE